MEKKKSNEHNENKEIKKGVITGFWAGILASLCCIGPLVIILLGLSSISFALSLGQYKPYFLGIGILFMIATIAFHLNKKNKHCDVNCFTFEGIKREKNFILSIVVSMAVIYILALYVIVPAIAPIVYGNAIQRTTQLGSSTSFENNTKIIEDTNQDKGSLHKLTVKISGMTCSGCATGIESMLQNTLGIVEAKISYPKGTGKIIYDSNLITKEEILNNEAFSIYSAELIKDEIFENTV